MSKTSVILWSFGALVFVVTSLRTTLFLIHRRNVKRRRSEMREHLNRPDHTGDWGMFVLMVFGGISWAWLIARLEQ